MLTAMGFVNSRLGCSQGGEEKGEPLDSSYLLTLNKHAIPRMTGILQGPSSWETVPCEI